MVSASLPTMNHELARNLPNKPLVEAIFELRWALRPGADPSTAKDPGFGILLGRFYDLVRTDYPTMVDLPATQVPEEMIPSVVRHQFRLGPGEWPLLQIGPGILTANDTAGYTWERFRPRLEAAVQALFSSYPTDIAALAPSQVSLRYLNALSVDPRTINLADFLRSHLHVDVKLDERLFDSKDLSDDLRGLNLSLTYPLARPMGTVSVSVATGEARGKPALIWQLEVRATGNQVPSKRSSFPVWIEDAHAVVEKWFFTMAEGQLLRSFEAADGPAQG